MDSERMTLENEELAIETKFINIWKQAVERSKEEESGNLRGYLQKDEEHIAKNWEEIKKDLNPQEQEKLNSFFYDKHSNESHAKELYQNLRFISEFIYEDESSKKLPKLVDSLENKSLEYLQRCLQSSSNFAYATKDVASQDDSVRALFLFSTIESYYKFETDQSKSNLVLWKKFLYALPQSTLQKFTNTLQYKQVEEGAQPDVVEFLYEKRCNLIHEGVHFEFRKSERTNTIERIDDFQQKPVIFSLTLDQFENWVGQALIHNIVYGSSKK